MACHHERMGAVSTCIRRCVHLTVRVQGGESAGRRVSSGAGGEEVRVCVCVCACYVCVWRASCTVARCAMA